jgi:FxsC-like protein
MTTSIDPGRFFVSYAHSAPTPEQAGETDPWVRTFFRDLQIRVDDRQGAGPEPLAGQIDQQIPLGMDWKAGLAEAIGHAQVLVPLYSPSYFTNAWALAELNAFRQRLAAAGVPDDRRIIPVLWVPFPPWEQELPEVAAALELAGVEAYRKNGLRALCMISSYSRPYGEVLNRVADRIVATAAEGRLGPATGLDLRLPTVETADTQFLVAVAAPAAERLPAERKPRGYGAGPDQWRPFAERQVVPLGEYAASIAQRLGLPTRIESVTDAAGLFGEHPAVLLIDPWFGTVKGGMETLRSTFEGLPPWVIPLVVVDDEGDPQYPERGTTLEQEVAATLMQARVRRWYVARRLHDFVERMQQVVVFARSQFFRSAPVVNVPDSATTTRPTLRGAGTEGQDGEL